MHTVSAEPAAPVEATDPTAPPPSSEPPASEPRPSVPSSEPQPREPQPTAPDTTDRRPEATDAPPDRSAGADDDLASAGDELFPEIGNDDLDVAHYTVRIAYDPADRQIRGAVVADLTAVAPLEQIVLDSVGLDVEGVEIDGVAAPFTTTDDELVIDHAMDAGEVASVAVTYVGEPAQQAGAFGLQAGWFATETGSYVLNEPDALRTWMPANDHPSDKATWRFELTVPEGLAGVANGELVEQTTTSGQTTWVWDQVEPMSTYLVQLLTGEYSVVDGGTAGASGTVPIVHVALTGDVERMQPYFDLTDDQIGFFETYFGPYPLDRYGLAITESYAGLAMETQGRSLFSRDDFPGGAPGYVEHLLLSHELAHQWFGDAVSPAEWSDLWLNESFATYGQWMWLEAAGLSTLESDAEFALSTRNAIGGEPTGEPTVGNLFGFERYDGGAVVLHALRRQIGDEAFFALLQRWVTDNDGASRSTDEFIALAEEVSGQPLSAFFDEWLFATDVPDQYPS